MTFEGMWEQAGTYLREHRSEYGRGVGALIREKPLAALVTGVGLAWLFFGPSTVPPRAHYTAVRRRRPYSVYDAEDERDFYRTRKSPTPRAGAASCRRATRSPAAPAGRTGEHGRHRRRRHGRRGHGSSSSGDG